MSDSAPPQEFSCPTCGQAVEATPAETAQLLLCPHCHNPLVIPDLAGSSDLPPGMDETAPDVSSGDEAAEPHDHPDDPDDPQADELNGLRIRQLAQSRRAVYRSRSYAFIASLVCLVAAVQLILNAARRFLHHIPGIRPYAYLCFALAALLAFLYFLRKTIELTRELNHPHVHTPPASTPDFTPLGDGSQRWKNLDQIK